ncbi:hypothetical protein VTN77DRAFT_9559 [Rasamsonia byssochlamydoides]|uniref:uncharacterized protein n=1 Tax=Rasamsonia byssochlamydoides TaxID=89139 RepID=UPI003743BB41
MSAPRILTPLQFVLFLFSIAVSVDPIRFATNFTTLVACYVFFYEGACALNIKESEEPEKPEGPKELEEAEELEELEEPEGTMMESKATDALAVLKNTNASIDSKVAALTSLKSDIKQKNVPEGAIAPIFESLRLAIAAQHSSLSAAGFSTLSHLLKRLYIQEHHHAVSIHSRQLHSLLLERLGDHKERLRAQAAQAFTDLWPASPQEIEHHVLEVALVGKNPRAKEMSMFWLSNMTKEHGLLFRAYVPSLVACLEDADSGVRETAKSTVIELFQNAPSRAKSDLKKQLAAHNVRKSIATAILSSLGLADQDMSSSLNSSRSETRRPPSSFSNHRPDPPRPNSVLSSRSQGHGETGKDEPEPPKQRPGTAKGEPARPGGLLHSDSVDSLAASADATAEGEGEKIEPLFVSSNRELDEIFRNMLPHFEGRETEQNWIPREKSILTLRRLTRGNAPQAYSQHYLAGIKSLLDGILKVVNSLRTTLSTSGCLLIQEMARTCGSGIDNMVEIIMQNLIKLCGGMKKISAQNGNATVDAVIANVTYTPRIMQHLWFACQDKNVQPRLYVTGWLKTLINKQARHKSAVEHGGGLELIEKCIKKGLSDANPGVRESMRGTFWTFHQVWPDRAAEIMSTLDNKSKALLEKDPANPNAHSSSHADAARSGFSNSASATTARQTLKETIAAQKKRHAEAKDLPPRPESAQSSFADTKPTRPAAHRTPAAKTTSTVRTVPTGTHLSSLSSAPVRPAIKPRRPELARPATADPYADRDRRPPSAASHTQPLSPETSPAKAKRKVAATPAAKPSSPSRPKSRLDAAPVSAAKNKPKKLDISTLKSGEARTPSNRLRSNSTHVPRPNHPVEDDVNLAVPQVEAPEIDLLSGEDPGAPVEVPVEAAPVTYQTANVIVQEMSVVEATLQDKQSTPLRHARVGSDESAIPGTTRGDSQTDNEEPKVVSPIPNGRQDQPFIPSPITREVSNGDSLKVYEDPEPPASTDAGVSTSGSRSPTVHFPPTKSSVLEELPVNEPVIPGHRDNKPVPDRAHLNVLSPGGAENTHRRWGKVESVEKRRSISPRSKDPAKAREMIDKGITRIRAKALDVHGYRKLQGLIKYHDAIFTDEAKYDEMLLALLDALEAPGDEKRSRPLDLKTQILVTIRLMFTYNRTYFSAYYPRAMTALLNTRKQYELTNHIVSGLEETAEDIVAACRPPDVIDAVLDLIETEEHDEKGYRAITMGIYVLTGLLRRLNRNRVYLSRPELERLGKFANKSLTQPQPDVRRAITEFCVELHEMVNNDEMFWRMIDSPVGDHRNLLTYFIAKKKSQGGRL